MTIRLQKRCTERNLHTTAVSVTHTRNFTTSWTFYQQPTGQQDHKTKQTKLAHSVGAPHAGYKKSNQKKQKIETPCVVL